MIDAAGAIYVIGGYDQTSLADVWASTDGGADRSQSRRSTGYLLRAFWYTLCTLRVPKYPSRTPTHPVVPQRTPSQYPRKYPGTTEVP